MADPYSAFESVFEEQYVGNIMWKKILNPMDDSQIVTIDDNKGQ